MRLLFLGDVVGRPGRRAVTDHLPALRERWRVDCVVINGENSAGGFGITEAICDELIAAGADAVTLGNHSWDQREALVFIAREPRLVRPANYPPGTPGRGAALVDTASGHRVLVVNVMGRLFMDALDDPFAAADREIGLAPLGEVADAILIDVHAEATSEKQAMAYHLDGRVSVVVGTHTHVPTADHRVLPGGTAHIADVGMTGSRAGVIGVKREQALRAFKTQMPVRFDGADEDIWVMGAAVEIGDDGLARGIDQILLPVST
jgi:metallophosphoesterase (TIGR00282 family)